MKFPKIEGQYPKYCCQNCGECIGYLGRFLEYMMGTQHKCGEKNA